jgi:hypothetical protein
MKYMKLYRKGILLLTLLVVAGSAYAKPTRYYSWRVNGTIQTGEDFEWVSPEPVSRNYLINYYRLDFRLKVEVRAVFFWIVLAEDNLLDYSELAGPLPSGEVVLIEEHLALDDPDVTFEGDVRIWLDPAGYVHFSVTNFSSSPEMRLTPDGTFKLIVSDEVQGDVNGNSILDEVDAREYRLWLAEAENGPDREDLYDLDNDGVITLMDELLIRHYIVGHLVTAYINWYFR